MVRVLKVYGSEPKQISQIPGARVIENYPAFLLVEASDPAVASISDGRLTEDITDQYSIDSGGRSIDTTIPRIASTGKALPHPAYDGIVKLPRGPHHYIVQFIGPIKKNWLALARKAGAEIVAPYEGFSIIARLTPDAVAEVSKLRVVRWLGHLPYRARMSDRMLQEAQSEAVAPSAQTPRTRYIADTFTVQFFRSDQAKAAEGPVRRLGFKIVDFPTNSEVMVVRFTGKGGETLQARLEKLSHVHGVRNIAPRPIRRPSNDRAAAIMGTSVALGSPPGLNLSGEGEVIGICDTGLDNGDPASIHPDFTGRIVAMKSYPISPSFAPSVLNPGHDDGPADLDSGHGTHTSGSIAGDGTASSNLSGLVGPVRGLSYRAKLVFQAVEQEIRWRDPSDFERYGRYVLAGLPSNLKTLFSFAYGKGARIHSNSWGGGDAGAYDDQCQQVDQFVWDRPDFCVLFAAGNDGRDGDADGVIDLGSVTPPGTSKNCITVGATENDRPGFDLTYGGGWQQDYPTEPIKSDRLADNPDQVAAFSSRGPTGDGRLKPDIVAPGTYILSTRSSLLATNNFGYGRYGSTKLYMFDSGTSMATPLTAGAVGIVREYLRKSAGIASPSAALLKAAVIAGAQMVGAGATAPDNNEGFGRLNLDNVVALQAPLKVVFAEGAGLSTGGLDERLVRVQQPGAFLKIVLVYSDFPGPTLVNNLNLVVRDPNGTAHVGNGGTSGQFDSTNNVELIIIQPAPVGDYRLQVIGSNVPKGPQPFALVIVGAV